MKYDFHTHTVYSEGIFRKHAKGTIEENVTVAREKGLSAISISDHGPGHVFYGVNKKKLPEIRSEINRLNEKYQDIDIFLSVEANIVNKGNGLDITPEECKYFDFILAGYHYGIPHAYCISNWLAMRKLKGERAVKKLAVKNTDMVVNALYKNPIKILTHPGDKGPFYMEPIAKACAETNTLMEISTWHRHLTVEEIKIAAKEDVKFVISSDAHRPERVGTFEGGIERALMAGLDLTRIVNIKTEEEL